MDKQLLSCPFCGGEAQVDVIEPHTHLTKFINDYMGGAFIECTSCTCALFADTEAGAIAAWKRRAQPWISVEDRPPDMEGDYLIYDGRGIRSCGYNGHGGWWTDYIVTHWAPLPAGPESEVAHDEL